MEEIVSFVEEELAGSGRLQGYRWLHLRAIQRGFVVSQEKMRMIIKVLDPEGVELRRARHLSTTVGGLTHCGIWIPMPFGIAMNGCIDGFSRHIMWMEAYNTNSDPKVIADYFINTVAVRADPGTENGHVRDMQLFLRRNVAGEGSFLMQLMESWWGGPA